MRDRMLAGRGFKPQASWATTDPMRLAWVCLLLSSCGPVLLGEEERMRDAGAASEDEGAATGNGAAPVAGAGAPGSVGTGTASPVAEPVVVVRIQPVECACFDLRAEVIGGVPPYDLEWGDGSHGPMRRVCVEGGNVAVAVVVALDAAGTRSAPQSVRLVPATDASCSQEPPGDEPTGAELCLQNPSFEGTPAPTVSMGQPFDAPPWTACTNPEMPNLPQIGNTNQSATISVPPPTDGVTYVAIGEGQQVSQELCRELEADETVHLQLDIARIDISAGAASLSEQVFLQIWGGLATDCSLHERLWASPSLQLGWQSFCVTLQPSVLTTQLTLRTATDMSELSLGYLLVDNLRPVDACP